ncbi:uncharacterized protein J4E78_009399 [Alternaria triticimaculans]|uniref:uncharacterized protein n=1 Tax=Alternaria triticimaculans TaxID=297637 RepID=UPI0020C45924|nr:uncharacterized protein J4E78_009399 [Alternaria triticimaculans]KAI4645487.1 hypothetical protein J4E78_009399 [Alternaria triticimaculans]
MASATFSDLPTELIVNVFAFIRQKKDQGIVCLVSRSWRELMAPILWEKLEFNLGDHQGSSPGRSLTTLLDPNSGILPHVRNLCFADFTDEDAENRLESLILALPRDKLRIFQAYGDMQHEVFLQLLRSQTKLEKFYAVTPFTCLGSTSDYHYASREYRAWVASLTPELKEISLLLEREEEDEEEEVEKNHRNLQSFIDLYPSLERLNLSADCDPPISLQELLSLSPESRLFSNLTSIKMEAMSLVPDALYQFSHNFDVTSLEKLHLKDCSSMSLFFDSLSESYIETPGKLRELCIRLDNGVEDEVQVETTTSIENFLKVCCARLENLELHLSNGKLVDKSCLLPHAETLRNVIIEKSQYGIPDSQSHYYSGDEVGVILRACTKLRGLAINLPPIDLGHITELGNEFQFKASERDCAAFKDVLTFEETPLMEERSFRASCEAAMKHYGDQIFSHMSQYGTVPRLLLVESFDTDDFEEGMPMEDCYFWPWYIHTRGNVRDNSGSNLVGAARVEMEKISRNYPGDFILRRFSS